MKLTASPKMDWVVVVASEQVVPVVQVTISRVPRMGAAAERQVAGLDTPVWRLVRALALALATMARTAKATVKRIVTNEDSE